MKKAGLVVFLPLILSLVFTLIDIFITKFLTSHFVKNPQLVILSFLELYIISAVTMIYVQKEISKH